MKRHARASQQTITSGYRSLKIVGSVGLKAIVSAILLVLTTTPRVSDAAEGHLRWVFGDIKHPLRAFHEKSGADDRITEENYRQIITGLKNNLHCNGVRIYIDPAIAEPRDYPGIYHKVVTYSRSQGLAIYANPFETHKLLVATFGKNKTKFAAWVVNYANHFRPEFLGPFNESGWSVADMVEIVHLIRARLKYSPQLIGPDQMHIHHSINELSKHRNLNDLFDVIGSHNAAGNEEATAEAWRELHHHAKKATWATENPRPISAKNSRGREIGIRAVLESGAIEGLVIYLAYPHCVNARGGLTEKGRGILQGIKK